MKVRVFYAVFANGLIIEAYRSCVLRRLVKHMVRWHRTHVVRFWKGTEIVAPWQIADLRGWRHHEA